MSTGLNLGVSGLWGGLVSLVRPSASGTAISGIWGGDVGLGRGGISGSPDFTVSNLTVTPAWNTATVIGIITPVNVSEPVYFAVAGEPAGIAVVNGGL